MSENPIRNKKFIITSNRKAEIAVLIAINEFKSKETSWSTASSRFIRIVAPMIAGILLVFFTRVTDQPVWELLLVSQKVIAEK